MVTMPARLMKESIPFFEARTISYANPADDTGDV